MKQAVAFVMILFVFLIWRMPLAAFVSPLVSQPGVIIGSASGSIWSGRLSDVSLAGQAIGDVDVALRPGTLFTGRLLFNTQIDGPNAVASGVIGKSLSGTIILEDFVAVLQFDPASMHPALAGAGREKIRAEIGGLEWTKAGCRSGEGSLSTDALVQGHPKIAWKGPVLEGKFQCSDAMELVGVFSGKKGPEVVELEIRVEPDGKYTIVSKIETEDPSLQAYLPGLGFQFSEGILVQEYRGNIVRKKVGRS